MSASSNATRAMCPAHASTRSPPSQRLTTSAASTRRCLPKPTIATVQEPATPDDDTFDAALETLGLTEIEEATGELHRRIASALRALGERRADRGHGEES